jgi:hypothetical protein
MGAAPVDRQALSRPQDEYGDGGQMTRRSAADRKPGDMIMGSRIKMNILEMRKRDL